MGDKFVLLVEGKDDEHVVKNLMHRHSFGDLPKIKPKDGIDNLLGTLDVELEGSDLVALGILVDADVSLDARWTRIKQILTDSGYNSIPDVVPLEGLILVQGSKPIFGAWLMPNNILNGILEDFLQYLVPNGEGNVLLSIARSTVKGLPEESSLPPEEKRFAAIHESKAIIYTWLAWQESPGKPFGISITAKFLDANANEATILINWLRNLFH